MKKIGGNCNVLVQVFKTTTNDIGEQIQEWVDEVRLHGFFDKSTANMSYQSQNANVNESTHYFICDYTNKIGTSARNRRMIYNDEVYDIVSIDNPMGLNYHLEFELKYEGL